MSSPSTTALITISVAIAIAISLTLSITVNFVYITQIIENLVVNIVDQKIDEFNQTLKIPIVNQTPVPIPTPTPTCPPDSFFNKTSQKCDPVVIPNPVPVPTPVPTPQPTPAPVFNQTLKIIITGDVEEGNAGTAVFNRIKAENPTNVFVLGDLGYEDNLQWFKSTYAKLGNLMNCVLGNHEARNEDGSSSLEAEAIALCGNNFYMKKGPTLFLFFNTNSDLVKAATESGKLLTNPDFMKGIKSVHINSHKGCAVPPNSHHGLEIKSFCDAIKSKIPSNVKAIYNSAHNHVLSSSADGTYKQSGAGGRSHYECGENTAFPFCNNSSYGFLEYTIKPDGTTTYIFKDYNGKLLQ